MKKLLIAATAACALALSAPAFAGSTAAPMQGDQSVGVGMSSATTTAFISGVSNQRIYVTGGMLWANGTGNLTFKYGTGTDCGTGTTSINSQVISMTAQTAFLVGTGLGPALVVPAGKDLCITWSTTATMAGWLTYAIAR
jgi:hypothetical protein